MIDKGIKLIYLMMCGQKENKINASIDMRYEIKYYRANFKSPAYITDIHNQLLQIIYQNTQLTL